VWHVMQLSALFAVAGTGVGARVGGAVVAVGAGAAGFAGGIAVGIAADWRLASILRCRSAGSSDAQPASSAMATANPKARASHLKRIPGILIRILLVEQCAPQGAGPWVKG
jgi:hypothetical protein